MTAGPGPAVLHSFRPHAGGVQRNGWKRIDQGDGPVRQEG